MPARVMPPARVSPIVGIPACVRTINERVFHTVTDKYPNALIAAAGCLPLLIPAIGSKVDMCGVLDALDGLLLTGSPSNVHPSEYGGEVLDTEILHDRERDATTLPLIREAVRRDLPVLAICRGIQELNVALGGTLHQRVHEVSGRLNHRYRKEFAGWGLRTGASGCPDPRRPVGRARRQSRDDGQFAAFARDRSSGPGAARRGGGARWADRGDQPARRAVRRRRAVAPRVQGDGTPVLGRAVFGLCPSLSCSFDGSKSGLARGLSEPAIGSRALHAFFLFRTCTNWGLFSLVSTLSAISRSGESMKLSQKRSRIPCGSDFPQTLLTCRRPVSPPTGRHCV